MKKVNPSNESKCYWCGNTKADFYHVECARKMSDSNSKSYSEVLLSTQEMLNKERQKNLNSWNIMVGQGEFIKLLLAESGA